MNKKEKNRLIEEVSEKTKQMLKQFKSKDGRVASEEGFTWRDISKIQFESYIPHEEISLDIYFYSKGRTGNNKPYTYHKKIDISMANKFRESLNEARRLDSTVDDEDIDPILNW